MLQDVPHKSFVANDAKSQLEPVQLKKLLVYRTPGFHEFGCGSSGTPLDQNFILGHPTSCFVRQPCLVIIRRSR